MGIKHDIEKYHRAVSFIESMAGLYPQHNIKAKDKLRIYRRFMKEINNPEKDFKIIHVGGTAGKGTVCSLIHAALVKAGHRTGLYISPHTTSMIERIKLNNRYMAAEAFYNILDKIKPTINNVEIPPDYYGLLVTIAFKYFSEEKCDYVILETGAGGLYDHSNIIPPPAITIITNVRYDHMAYLGNTLLEIARHKAGLIKNGTKFITSDKNPKVVNFFKKRCQQKGAEFNWVRPNNEPFNDINVKLAQAALDKLNIKKIKINKEIIEKSGKLPCRQEIIQKSPMIMLDGAHNPAKIEALISYVKKMKRPIKYLIIGISANKDWRTILKTIAPHVKIIVLTRYLASRRNTVPPLKMKKYINKHFPKRKPIIFWDPFDALNHVLKKSTKKDFILITGSMYLAGELRTRWVSEENILRYRSSFQFDHVTRERRG